MRKGLKILHYIGSLNIGGEQTYLITILNRLPSYIENIVVYNWSDYLKDSITNPNVQLIKLSAKKLTNLDLNAYLFLKEFYKVIKENKIKLVATYSPGASALSCWIAAKILNLPIVHTIQRSYGNRSKWESMIITTPGLSSIIYRLPTTFIALSRYYAYDFIKRWKIPREKIYLSYIGIDLGRFYPSLEMRNKIREQFSFNNDIIVLGFVGRLSPEKGLHKVLNLLKRLVYEYNLQNIILLIVGDGPKKEYYYELVKKESLENKVIFAGARKDIPYIMNGIDIYIQATDNPLNGITSIEAMGCGKPIFTLVQNEEEKLMAQDTVSTGENGGFIEINNGFRGIELLIEAIKDREKIETMGQFSRRMCEKRFNIETHIEELLNLYFLLTA